MEKTTNTFGAISTPRQGVWSDEFQNVYEDAGYAFFLSKAEFYHDVDEDLEFHYRYGIIVNINDVSNTADILLSLFIRFSEIHPDHQKNIQGYIGDEDEFKNLVEEDDLSLYHNVEIHGLHALMEAERIKFSEEADSYYPTDVPEIVDKLNTIADTYKAIDGLRGFHLDRELNALGTTGWDILRYILHYKPL